MWSEYSIYSSQNIAHMTNGVPIASGFILASALKVLSSRAWYSTSSSAVEKILWHFTVFTLHLAAFCGMQFPLVLPNALYACRFFERFGMTGVLLVTRTIDLQISTQDCNGTPYPCGCRHTRLMAIAIRFELAWFGYRDSRWETLEKYHMQGWLVEWSGLVNFIFFPNETLPTLLPVRWDGLDVHRGASQFLVVLVHAPPSDSPVPKSTFCMPADPES